MPLTDISAEAKLWTNHDDVPLDGVKFEGDDGLVEVERSDENEVAVHFRHYADEAACMSAYMTRAQAAALLTTLRAAIE